MDSHNGEVANREQQEEAPGVGTGGQWNSAERDSLKRLILQFGVPGRWDIIRESSQASDKLLCKASNVELQSYSISFVKALLECLNNSHENKKVDPQDVIDLKEYLTTLVSKLSNSSMLPIESNLQMWGGAEIMNFRAVMWSKRLEILTQLNHMIDCFHSRKKEVMDSKDSDMKKIKGFCSREILLSFVPLDMIQGQKPAPWWNPRIHDVDLFYGTFVHGYGNYN